ncbi:MAG: GAF domain-containing sensor histidine kinase [Xenococcaceae cyanobacterium]
MVRNIATQCAIAIDQTQLFEQLQQQRQREQLLNQIAQTLNSRLNPEQILQDILKRVGESFNVDQVILFRLDEEKLQIPNEWRVNDQIPSLLDIKTPLREWREIINSNCKYQKCQCFQTLNSAEYTEIVKKQISQEIEDFQPRSVLSMPIFIHEQFFGSLTLQTTTKTRTFTPEEVHTIECIAEQTAIALHNVQIYENIEELVKARTQELEEEKQRYEAAHRAKSEFLSHMSHELRTPLTGILGFSRMLRDEIFGSLNQKQMQYVSAIADSGEYLLQLINDLLDISKIQADREELFLEKVPVQDLCLASMSIVQEWARQEGLELILDIEPSIDFCLADQQRLKQILVNLLSNAVKFTEAGSVTLKVEPKEKKLEFSVIDTGIGIKEADQKKLFKPFCQIHTHLSRKYKGTGLGLALSRKLARLHGGDLTLTSEECKGSCFTLHLPAEFLVFSP